MFKSIYFIHNPSSKEREKFISNITNCVSKLPHFSIDLKINYIWKVSGEDLKEEQLSYFKNGASSYKHFKNACSLVLNHMECLELFIASEEEYTIIFEDDCFCNDIELLKNTLDNIKNIDFFDTVYLGDGCFPNANKDNPNNLIKVNGSRCTEAIVYSKEGAKKILEYYHKCLADKNVFCLLDFYFTDCYSAIKDYVNYHVNPTPIHQGTIYGLLSSSINC